MVHIAFVDTVPVEGPFALFEYDEARANTPGFIDIRGVVQTHEQAWMDELAQSHAALFSRLCAKTRWVWASAPSRLDARPWGQEARIKTLFFAVAVLHWLDGNPDVKHLSLVNCPGEVSDYLCDMRSGISVEGARGAARVKAAGTISALLRDVFNALRYHGRRSFAGMNAVGANLVAFERLHNATVSEGHRYYFTSLLDDVSAEQLSFLVTGSVPPDMRGADDATRITRFVATDGCSIFDILRAVFVHWQVRLCLGKAARAAPACSVGGARTGLFWQRFLGEMAGRSDVFNAYLAYRGAARLLCGGRVKRLVFPYEEKGIERALIFAATEAGVETLGFTPHPQHPLAVSMRDRDDSNCPKPDAYGVCGSAYEPFFRNWGNKTVQSIDVWGTQKGMLSVEVPPYAGASERPRILLTLSHPHELRVFKSWLEAEPALAEKADILLRRYRAVDGSLFERELAAIQKRFPEVSETQGSLMENVADCDVVLFCGTSAGLEAVQLGRVGVYVGLNDFFVMNPCFNDLSDMHACMTARELASFLDTWRELTNEERNLMLTRQRVGVQKLFAPIDRNAIQKTLS